jgi:uncharacterized LabA/DUF88 family protein
MRRIVLIDGENLVYGLRHLLGEEGSLASRESVEKFNFRGMIEEILADNLPTEILWFGARLKLYEQNDEIRLKSSKAIRIQSAFVNHIQKQKIDFVKVGYLRARESEPCEKCEFQSWKLTEKGVDVGLAIRMMVEANEKTEIIVISADTDLMPAFKASMKLGAKVMHVGYEFRPVHALFNASNSARTITLPIAQKYRS